MNGVGKLISSERCTRNACWEIEMIEQSIGTLGVALERKKIYRVLRSCNISRSTLLRYIKQALYMQKNISITDKYFISAKLIDHFENFDITVFFFSSKSFKVS